MTTDKEVEKHLEKIAGRIKTMRQGGMEISPAFELIILKEAELAYKSGQKEIRLRMERLAYEIDNAQNEYEECERELKRRRLKI